MAWLQTDEEDAEPVEVARGMTSEAALAVLLQMHVAELDAHLAFFLERDEAQGAHKSRVALRRITTVLDGFKPLFRTSAWNRARRECKAIFRQLGKVRDAEVFLAALSDAARHDKRLKAIARLRDGVRADLRKRRAIRFGQSLLQELADGALLRRKPAGLALRSMPVEQLASAALDAQHSGCIALGSRDLAELGVEELHEFRKQLKSFRYSAEFFAPLWIHPDWPRLRRDLQRVQDALGDLNDQANARLQGAMVGTTAAEAALNAAQKYWDRVKAIPAWWRESQVS